jgi:cyclophilin family peptidyl-prolyl cis-trans isomerase
MVRFISMGLTLMIGVMVIGCGGGGGIQGPITITLSPQTANVPIRGSQVFFAGIEGTSNRAVTWSIQEGSAGGTMNNNIYTAPDTVGTYHIVVTSVADPTKSATATVNVIESPSVSLNRSTALTVTGGTLEFIATVAGTLNTAVDWSIEEGAGGAITPDGVYTAPTTEGTYHVVATSRADNTKKATATVEISNNVNVVMQIQGRGTLTLRMRMDRAPRTCRNFVDLVNKAFYDGILFHRVEAGFVVQAGDPQTKEPGWNLDDPRTGQGGPGYTIDFEPNSLKHVKYALAMARSSDINSAGSQFYVCLEEQPSLDGQYTVFGLAVRNTGVVDSIQRGDKINSATVVKRENP